MSHDLGRWWPWILVLAQACLYITCSWMADEALWAWQRAVHEMAESRQQAQAASRAHALAVMLQLEVNNYENEQVHDQYRASYWEERASQYQSDYDRIHALENQLEATAEKQQQLASQAKKEAMVVEQQINHDEQLVQELRENMTATLAAQLFIVEQHEQDYVRDSRPPLSWLHNGLCNARWFQPICVVVGGTVALSPSTPRELQLQQKSLEWAQHLWQEIQEEGQSIWLEQQVLTSLKRSAAAYEQDALAYHKNAVAWKDQEQYDAKEAMQAQVTATMFREAAQRLAVQIQSAQNWTLHDKSQAQQMLSNAQDNYHHSYQLAMKALLLAWMTLTYVGCCHILPRCFAWAVRSASCLMDTTPGQAVSRCATWIVRASWIIVHGLIALLVIGWMPPMMTSSLDKYHEQTVLFRSAAQVLWWATVVATIQVVILYVVPHACTINAWQNVELMGRVAKPALVRWFLRVPMISCAFVTCWLILGNSLYASVWSSVWFRALVVTIVALHVFFSEPPVEYAVTSARPLSDDETVWMDDSSSDMSQLPSYATLSKESTPLLSSSAPFPEESPSSSAVSPTDALPHVYYSSMQNTTELSEGEPFRDEVYRNLDVRDEISLVLLSWEVMVCSGMVLILRRGGRWIMQVGRGQQEEQASWHAVKVASLWWLTALIIWMLLMRNLKAPMSSALPQGPEKGQKNLGRSSETVLCV